MRPGAVRTGGPSVGGKRGSAPTRDGALIRESRDFLLVNKNLSLIRLLTSNKDSRTHRSAVRSGSLVSRVHAGLVILTSHNLCPTIPPSQYTQNDTHGRHRPVLSFFVFSRQLFIVLIALVLRGSASAPRDFFLGGRRRRRRRREPRRTPNGPSSPDDLVMRRLHLRKQGPRPSVHGV